MTTTEKRISPASQGPQRRQAPGRPDATAAQIGGGAAGRGPAEILAELRRRLANDSATEDREVAEQLGQITRLRLEELVGG